MAGNTVQEAQNLYGSGKGYYMGDANDYSAKYAIDETRFWHFLEATQNKELEKIQRSSEWKLRILERYDRMVRKYGILRILRKGLEVEDAKFTMLYQLPMASSSQSVKDNFEKNEFNVTRQVRYNLDNGREEIDRVVFVNGLAKIIQHFVRFDGKAKDALSKRTLFFPRYHQMDLVRKILSHASKNGVGHTYLIQYSAGSGKSNSITWASYKLIETYPERAGLPGGNGFRNPLFD